MKEMDCMYILIDGVNKIHYGAWDDEFKAREKAREYEILNHLPKGQIDIYEIPHWEFHFKENM